MKAAIRTLTLVWLVAAAACGQTPSPLAPSTPDPTSSSTGATINGTVTGTLPGKTTVGVTGTSIVADIDGANHFQLRDVPTGSITLQFTGPGLSAALNLTGVQPARTLDITVAIEGSGVKLDDKGGAGESEVQIKGAIDSINAVAKSLVVAGATVGTSATTAFDKNGGAASFADLFVGAIVEVHGTGGPAGIVATSIHLEVESSSPGVPAPGLPPGAPSSPVELRGFVTGFSGSAAAFVFTLNGLTVSGDGSTTFIGSVFGDLKNGIEVEVKGTLLAGIVHATSIHVEDPGDDNGTDPIVEVAVTGVLTSRSGSEPVLTLVVAGKTVTTSASTVVKRKGVVIGFSALVVNALLEVEGTAVGNTIAAKSISVEDDLGGGGGGNNSEVDLKGEAGAVSGGCPVVTFGLNGFTVATSGATDFRLACNHITAGRLLEVRGIKQPDGTVLATRVNKGN